MPFNASFSTYTIASVDSPPTAPPATSSCFSPASPDYVAANQRALLTTFRAGLSLFSAFACSTRTRSTTSGHSEPPRGTGRRPPPPAGSVTTSRSNAVPCPSPPPQLLASLAELLGRRTDSGPTVAVPHPQDAGSPGIHDHGGIAVSLAGQTHPSPAAAPPQVRWCPH